jgi:hypothetical protein
LEAEAMARDKEERARKVAEAEEALRIRNEERARLKLLEEQRKQAIIK